MIYNTYIQRYIDRGGRRLTSVELAHAASFMCLCIDLVLEHTHTHTHTHNIPESFIVLPHWKFVEFVSYQSTTNKQQSYHVTLM